MHAKTAVILVDGLAIDQWVTLKAQWALDAQLNESAVFAWVPSVTSVSRQALFSGKAPYQFANTIQTTSNELKAWRQFWQDHGLDKNAVYYEKSLGNDDVNALIDRLSDRRFKAVGLVINTVDDMMHGMQVCIRWSTCGLRETTSRNWLMPYWIMAFPYISHPIMAMLKP